MFTRIDHIGVAVAEIEPALELYRDRLGLPAVHREVVQEQGVDAALLDVGEGHIELLAPLGLTPAEVWLGEHVVGTRIEADRTGATAVPGVWVAGNIADIQAQVITSAAAELTAGAAINLDLVLEETRNAAGARRHQRTGGEPAALLGRE